MSRIRGTIAIDRPVEEVFDFVADERHEPAYNPEMVSVDKLTEGPVGEGTRWRAVMRSRGRERVMTIEVRTYERPWLLASRTTTSGMDIEGRLTFTEEGTGTWMDWDWEVRPHGWLRLLGPLVTRTGQAQEERVWTGLKRLLEERSA